MKKGRSTILTFSTILLFAGIVHADMIPVSQEDAVCRQSPDSCAPADLQDNNLSGTSDFAGIADQDFWSVEFLPKADIDAGQAAGMQNLQSLTEGTNSLKYCLSALISLGLCCSGHWVKRLSLGFIPEWYHEGGPFQIGHSHALMPGTLQPVPACCFIQPDCSGDNPLAQYRLETIEFLWRKSQFALDVIYLRGPPAPFFDEGNS